MLPHHRSALALCVLCSALLVGALAHGQSPGDKAAAQVAFDKGIALMEAGKVAKACPLFEDSLRLDSAMGTQYQLAQCYEQSGRLASAWASYTAVADRARAANMADREQWARERADALAPRLSKLTIVVPATVAAQQGLTIQRDGDEVPRSLWGEAIPVDGGPHRIVANAPGRPAWSGDVSVAAEGGSARIEVPEQLGAATPGTATSTAEDSSTESPVGQTDHGDGDGSAQAIAGLVVAGVGVGVMAAGVAVGLVAKSGYDESEDEHCRDGFCDAEGLAAADDARGLGDAATGLFIGGSAALVAGVVTWLTAPSDTEADAATDPAASRRSLDVVAGPGQAGLAVRLRW